LFLAAADGGSAQAGFITVPGDSNIYGAGHATAPGPAGFGGGQLPPSLGVAGGGFLTFQVTGLVSYNGGGNFYGPDGGQYLGAATHMDSYGGISGIRHDSRTFFLVGVFLSNQEPADPAPPILDFTDDSFASVSPELNQTFFIGDGLTGTGTGSEQRFYVPAGATRLFLGFADGIDFTGLPGTYGDDIGSLDAQATLTSVPEPSSLTLLGIGAAGLLGCAWRKRAVA
jgi:hypothetical protein